MTPTGESELTLIVPPGIWPSASVSLCPTGENEQTLEVPGVPTGENEKALKVPGIRVPDQDILWAGESSFDRSLCFGTEDGYVWLLNGGPPARPFYCHVATSGEAINGVVDSEGVLAVSTPSEVIFRNIPRPGETPLLHYYYDGGAHGVSVTPSGKFIAPLGRNGLLLVEVRRGEKPVVTNILGTPDKTYNFYKSIGLGGPGPKDVIVSALRRDGLTVIVRDGDFGSSRGFSSPRLDVVDVCSLATDAFPFAAAALDIDGSLCCVRDVQEPGRPEAIRFDNLRGTAYRVFSARGHLFILTSESLYAFVDAASRFLGGGPVVGPVKSYYVDVQAVDAALVYDRTILLVKDDGSVRSLEIDALVDDWTAVPTSVAILTIQPEWISPPNHDLAYAVR